MKYESIADIYSANEKIRAHFLETVAGVSDGEAKTLPDDEKWTIQELAEHVGIVENNIARICSKLVEGAKTNGKLATGADCVSPEVMAKWAGSAGAKLEAPERVRPTGTVPIPDALETMDANRKAFAALRADFETYDMSGSKFPHPYFGDLTAIEWLILAGGHEARHTAQIEELLLKIRQ